jgi:DNA-binding transcriptional MocR family regulator
MRVKPLLYEVVANSIIRYIEAGNITAGERVPSLRQVSAQHGVSVSTAAQAYVAIENRGLIVARPKSGFFVAPRSLLNIRELQPSRPGKRPTRIRSGDIRSRIIEIASDPDILPLGAATPGPELIPFTQLNRTMASACRRARAAALGYSHPAGCDALRHQLARRSLHWGCQLSPEDFVVTSGAMEALSLSLRATTRQGEIVALESPSFFGVLQAIEALGLRVLEIPTHPRTGLDLSQLATALRRERIAVVLSAPSFNNPLGSCMPTENRRRLLELVMKHQVPLIEDDTYGDLPFPPMSRPRAVKGFDTEGFVLHCGSVSKTLAPGWRVGWVAAGERYYDKIVRLKTSNTVTTATPQQLALADFFRDGDYDRNLRRLRRSYASQVQQMSDAVAKYFPPNIRLSRPRGGFFLWIELPKKVKSMTLHAHALAQGISIAPGSVFSADSRQFDNFIRLNCGLPWSRRVEHAVTVLGALVKKLDRA